VKNTRKIIHLAVKLYKSMMKYNCLNNNALNEFVFKRNHG